MFSFKKHSQKEKLIKRSKKRTTIIASVVIIFIVAISLILSLSLRYYPSPGYKYMKHQVGHKNVARSDKIQKRILKDDSEHVGIMFDTRDTTSNHAFYGTDADETKKKDQKKAVKSSTTSQGWARYIEDSKKDDSSSWYYIDTARDKGANHYKTQGEAIDEFLVSNKDENSMWFDANDNGTDITGDIPYLYDVSDKENYEDWGDGPDSLETKVKFNFVLESQTSTPEEDTEGDGTTPISTSSTIEPAKKDKGSAGDMVLAYSIDAGTSYKQLSTSDGLKTSWLYLEKDENGNYQPQLIVYGLEIEQDSATEEGEEETIKPSAGSEAFWESIEEAAWY